MLIKNGTVFTNGTSFEKKEIEIEGIQIKSLHSPGEAASGSDVYDAEGCYVIPGLVDLHFHGCVGSDISDHDLEGIRKMAAYELKSGITAICPATMTLSEKILSDALSTAKQYVSETAEADRDGAVLTGINLEGPFVSPAMKGAQNPDYIMNPDLAMFHRLLAKAPGLPKLITLAPELPGAMEFIKEASKDIVISLGHSTADYETATEAFQKGASHVTHLFNAMPPFAHRQPGLIGAAADDPGCMAELICDGIHIHESAVRAAFKLFPGRMILISDSMRATGLEDGTYDLGGQQVIVKGRLAALADGTIAGSATNLFDCMRTAISFGIAPETAIACATANPAKSIGMYDSVGSLTPGKYADILLLDPEYRLVRVL